MLVVEIGAVATTRDGGRSTRAPVAWLVTVWLWLTVLFGTLAESVAEGRGKAQAASLRALQQETTARRVARRRDQLGYAGNLAALPDRGGRRAPGCVPATWSSSRPASGSPATATSSRASPASTSRPSPASPRPVIRESGGDRSRRHRRHRGALRPDRRPDHLRARPVLRGPDDRPRRGLRAAAHPQRDRPQRAARSRSPRSSWSSSRRSTRSPTTATPTSPCWCSPRCWSA